MAGIQPRCDFGKQHARPMLGFGLDKHETLGTSAPDDWCDSGLECLSGTALSLDDSFSNETSKTWGPRSPPHTASYPSLDDTDKHPMDFSSLGGGERLDSAIGDSITDETVGSISQGLGTMHLNEPVISYTVDDRGRQAAPSLEEERQRRDEMLNTLNFVSEDGDTALHLALIHEHWAFVQYLLGVIALDRSWVPYLDIQNHLGQTALHLAVIVDQSQCVRGLLWGGASAELQERGGNTPLHLAVRELRQDCVREITSNCQSTDYLHVTNYSGVSALHLAVQRGKEDIISMLIEAGADVNQRDPGSGRSPLHWAVESQSPRVVQLLLQRGANVDQPSYAGHTALYCSLHRPNKEVQALLKAGGASDAQAQDEEERESEEEFDDVVINGQRVH
ncbi:NF-kappa-B inhibitor alpha-like [Oncorhynchus tshawytscha]|uniref:NF-kappa-B inhibitor alpha n=2 Tax=Oncorhynchus TaxID=8016 RepID=A0A8C7IEK5_ONCKI|nr:NF-kappa-B inhibitor alpha-like [Oncorhynchus kisutch]XP_024275920.1 NF-kappa-B inhibitor alpha-like [Oncorhynchus tshawytscha]